jgi:Holliday junction resolvasome RuvABC DNA-binding subunit
MRTMDSRCRPTNSELAEVLDEISQRLRRQAASPFRVAAYRAAAETVRALNEPVAELFRREHVKGLESLPGVGRSIARKLAELIRRGRLRSLENLRRKQAANDTLTSLPMIGPLLAARIRNKLGIDSLEEVYAAAYDGRLQRIAGVGRKRVQAIRESLAVRLDREAPTWRQIIPSNEPPVETLLEIDRLYRERASRGRLLTVAPRKFNPTGSAWLPILRITRHGHRYCAAFANTPRSHQLGHERDWVVIYRETKADFGIWTVLTSQYGTLQGKRIIRGREAECKAYYDEGRPVQLSMLPEGETPVGSESGLRMRLSTMN